MAEQVRRKHFRRNATAFDSHEPATATRGRMDGAAHELTAGSRLSRDKDRGGPPRHGEPEIDGAHQGGILADQPCWSFGDGEDGGRDQFAVGREGQIIPRAGANCRDRAVGRRINPAGDDGQCEALAPQPVDQGRHVELDTQQHQVCARLAQDFHRRFGGRRRFHIRAPVARKRCRAHDGRVFRARQKDSCAGGWQVEGHCSVRTISVRVTPSA